MKLILFSFAVPFFNVLLHIAHASNNLSSACSNIMYLQFLTSLLARFVDRPSLTKEQHNVGGYPEFHQKEDKTNTTTITFCIFFVFGGVLNRRRYALQRVDSYVLRRPSSII
uniref:Putative secreted peptide n=1 Tax=Anopheles braziliensis TaxID=58242 RepID=A0A2M3ZPM5_9DIPT